MGLKSDWSFDERRALSVVLPVPARAVIDRASRLTRVEIVRLDIADREHPELQLAMWDVLRSQLENGARTDPPVHGAQRGMGRRQPVSQRRGHR